MREADLTVVIPSYQRRDSLLRLLGALAGELRRLSATGATSRVVVVVDGSTDSSAEAAGALSLPYELTVLHQPNRGRAAARNAGLAAAGDGIVLFLDDDVRPSPGLVQRHLLDHRDRPGSVVVGPCVPGESAGHSPAWLAWWNRHHAELARSARVERFDQFTVANASAEAKVFREAGGFDESFVGYGVEDYELGARLLERGVTILYDEQALAWHEHLEDEAVALSRERSVGRNLVRLVELHPELLERVFPPVVPTIATRVVAAVPFRRAAVFAALSWAAGQVALEHPWVLGGHVSLAYQVAHKASFAAGVAEAGPEHLGRVLGHRRAGREHG